MTKILPGNPRTLGPNCSSLKHLEIYNLVTAHVHNLEDIKLGTLTQMAEIRKDVLPVIRLQKP